MHAGVPPPLQYRQLEVTDGWLCTPAPECLAHRRLPAPQEAAGQRNISLTQEIATCPPPQSNLTSFILPTSSGDTVQDRGQEPPTGPVKAMTFRRVIPGIPVS